MAREERYESINETILYFNRSAPKKREYSTHRGMEVRGPEAAAVAAVRGFKTL
jgi:hypothetical protein